MMYEIDRVGADVEMFLRDAKTNRLVIACGKIGGTKNEPRKILDGKYTALQEDNVMLEFNIDPANSPVAFCSNLNRVLVHIFEELEEKGLVVDIAPSRVFMTEDLQHPQAQVMGCEGDYSAWKIEPNPLIKPEQLGNLRTSGGHVHVTFKVEGKDPEFLHKVNMIRALDLALGIPSVILDDDQDRRRHYGRAGAWRDKGGNHVEYRTLSNFWIKNDVLKEWVFRGVEWARHQLNLRWPISKDEIFGELYSLDVEKCIKNGDTILANKIIRDLEIPMPK